MALNQVATITVYIAFRPFEGEWIERNRTVLNALAWQNIPALTVKFACWDDERPTLGYAEAHGHEVVVVPWTTHYLFPGRLRSFKLMLEACLNDCGTELFVYMNGDIVLGPGVLEWASKHAGSRTLLSLPRHNWRFEAEIAGPQSYERAVSKSEPEPWTALDLFVMPTSDARDELVPVPPFILTAGSMDSWLVAKTGSLAWRRCMIPPDRFSMLHIEHPVSHPLKPDAGPDKLPRWAFNCGVYAQAVAEMPAHVTGDTTLKCFEKLTGAESYNP